MSPDPRRAAQIQNAQIGFDIHPGREDPHASHPALYGKGPQEKVEKLLPCVLGKAHGKLSLA